MNKILLVLFMMGTMNNSAMSKVYENNYTSGVGGLTRLILDEKYAETLWSCLGGTESRTVIIEGEYFRRKQMADLSCNINKKTCSVGAYVDSFVPKTEIKVEDQPCLEDAIWVLKEYIRPDANGNIKSDLVTLLNRVNPHPKVYTRYKAYLFERTEQ